MLVLFSIPGFFTQIIQNQFPKKLVKLQNCCLIYIVSCFQFPEFFDSNISKFFLVEKLVKLQHYDFFFSISGLHSSITPVTNVQKLEQQIQTLLLVISPKNWAEGGRMLILPINLNMKPGQKKTENVISNKRLNFNKC